MGCIFSTKLEAKNKLAVPLLEVSTDAHGAQQRMRAYSVETSTSHLPVIVCQVCFQPTQNHPTVIKKDFNCPGQHGLLPSLTTLPDPGLSWYCSACDEEIPVGAEVLQCLKCEYGICKSCAKKQAVHKCPRLITRWCDECIPKMDSKYSSLSTTVSSRLGVTASFLEHFLNHHMKPEMKTWELKSYIVHEATASRKCPLVEVLDPRFVATATVFVSHAYSYKVQDTIDAILRYEKAHPGNVYWFDPFSLCQHTEGKVVETEQLLRAFGDRIKEFNATLIVASPWKNPAFLSRAWCLFEFMSSQNAGKPIEIILPRIEEERFVKGIKDDSDVFVEVLSSIDARTAQAREASDLKVITELIESSVTHAVLNELALEAMRDWVVATGLEHERKLRGDGSDSSQDQLCDFQMSFSITLKLIGELSTAERVAREVLLAEEKRKSADDNDVLVAMSNLGLILWDAGQNEEAEQLLRRALEGQDRVEGPNSLQSLSAVNNLANVLSDLGRNKEAEEFHRRALRVREKLLGPKHEKTATSKLNLACELQDMGKLGEAEVLMREGLAGFEELLGPRHPSTLLALNNLANLYQETGRLDVAESLARRSVTTYQELFGPRNMQTITGVGNLVGVLQDVGKLQEAEKWQLQVVQAWRDAGSAQIKRFLYALDVLYNLQVEQGKVSDAEAVLREGLEASLRELGPENGETLTCMSNLGVLLSRLGRAGEAIELLERAQAASEVAFGASYPDTLNRRGNLGLALAHGAETDANRGRGREMVRGVLARLKEADNVCDAWIKKFERGSFAALPQRLPGV